MYIKDVLDNLKIGNAVAEYENDIESYFLETSIFKKIINNDIDIITGAKGTGKSAIYSIIKAYNK